MGNIFLTAKSGDDNKGRGLHGGQWLKVLNFGRFLVGCNMGCKGPLQYRSLLTSVASCYGARLRTNAKCNIPDPATQDSLGGPGSVARSGYETICNLTRIQPTLLSTAAKADLHSRVWNISQAIWCAPR